MNRYRKGIAAALGAIVQVGILLDEQLDAGTIPDEWVPWVRLLAAVATVVGVVWVRNEPQTVYLRRGRGDLGSARPGLLGAFCAFAAAVLLVITAAVFAGPAEAHRRLEHVRVNRACMWPGAVLDVAFSLEQLRGRAWAFLEDDGAAAVELHHVGAAAGPGGHWQAYPDRTASGGEGHLRVDVAGLPYWDAVRVLHGGVASSQRLPEVCPA